MRNEPGNRRGVTLIYDTGAREDDALERFQWVLPAIFLASSFLLLLATLQWQAPHFPVLVFVGVVLIPMGLVLRWKVGSGPVKKLAAPLGAVALFGLPLLAWNVGLYRALPLFFAGDLLPVTTLMMASGDRSDQVASIACQRVFDATAGDLETERKMRALLEARPAVARRCLDKIEERHPQVALSVARHLHNSWYDGWMSGEEMTDQVGCAAAEAYGSTASLHGQEGFSRLLMCSLGAANEEVSTCCAKALSEHATREDILRVTPQAWEKGHREALFLALVEAVDLPAATLMDTKPVSESLQWTPADLFHWTTHVGCHLLEEGSYAETIALRLSRSIKTQCGLDVDDPLFSFAALRFVRQTCEGALTVDESRAVDVVQWCDAARGATRETAVAAAQFVVARGRHAFLVSGLEGSIARGHAHRRSKQGVNEAHLEEARRFTQEAQQSTDFVSPIEEGAAKLRELEAMLREQRER